MTNIARFPHDGLPRSQNPISVALRGLEDSPSIRALRLQIEELALDSPIVGVDGLLGYLDDLLSDARAYADQIEDEQEVV